MRVAECCQAVGVDSGIPYFGEDRGRLTVRLPAMPSDQSGSTSQKLEASQS